MIYKKKEIPQPLENQFLWRYMDFYKFHNMFVTKTLHFCRVDFFVDSLEGSIPEWQKNNKIKTLFNFLEKYKCYNYANCWTMENDEKEKKWNEYTKEGYGVAIKTSYDKICKSLHKAKQRIMTGKVSYIDYSKNSIPTNNLAYPFFTKQERYSDEKEFRLLYSDLNNNVLEPNNNKGVEILVDLNLLIEKIVVKSRINSSLYKKVEDLLISNNMDFPIVNSKSNT